MRLIDADALRVDYFVTSTTTNTPLHRYVSMEQIDAAPTIEAAAIEGLQSEVERLKDVIDELREAQTYIDHYGDKWMTSAKDVPTSAYNHGYMDGKNEALTLENCIDRLHELGWLQEHDRIISQPQEES